MMKMDWEITAILAKPCPFCGSRKIVTETKEHFEEGNKSCSYLECLNCGAQLYGEVDYENGLSDGTYKTAQRTVHRMWNRRAS